MTDIGTRQEPTHSVPYGEGELRFFWRRGDKRPNDGRRARIHVHPDGLVEVETPPDTSLVETKQALLKRARWVTRHLQEIQARRHDALAREYVSGETLFYLGRRHPLKLIQAEGATRVKLLRGQLRVSTPDTSRKAVKAALEQWYREHAKAVFARRLETIAERLPWVSEAPPWTIRAMKTQWGSCSRTGSILLNPHLVKTPIRCIDYVILHELCHLKEHNHSGRFYQLLDIAMPDWREIKDRLDGMSELYLSC
ncbi:putative metal-dependent hydrolase [Natronospira proteinivora]|uniref:Metal-dependent hydrolase n=1 Tax=Natronospira proteinivora TaxID=1807133 RepID=A0ABT1GBJ8_9GAMM|nr:SprT family zinc-dependent metalloprotease [Natronospira proteinivora]MCP1728442.1 putative metal-dependent hydrolase [Natronospira proteinivora]